MEAMLCSTVKFNFKSLVDVNITFSLSHNKNYDKPKILNTTEVRWDVKTGWLSVEILGKKSQFWNFTQKIHYSHTLSCVINVFFFCIRTCKSAKCWMKKIPIKHLDFVLVESSF